MSSNSHRETTPTTYYLAGFFLTVRVPRPLDAAPDLLPQMVTTLSGCLAGFVPTVYWNDYLSDDEKALGLREDDLEAIKAWTEAAFNVVVGFPDVFYTLEAARTFRERFLPHNTNLVLLGAGLEAKCTRDVLHYDSLTPNLGENGVYYLLNQHRAMPQGGTVLGHELVGYERGLMDSWLCSGLETVASEKYGIKPNVHGFISDFAAAKHFTDIVNHGVHAGEPVVFYPWLVVQYPLVAP